MARLGDFARARSLLKAAAAGFAPTESVYRARCILAQAEIDLASRDLAESSSDLDDARTTLEHSGDRVNAAHAGHLQVRRLVLIGRLREADQILSGLSPAALPPAYQAAHELVIAALDMRRLQAASARSAIQRAETAARAARSQVLLAEVDRAIASLEFPAAKLIRQGHEQAIKLEEVERILASNTTVVVDGCRRSIHLAGRSVDLAKRPVLFALARALAKAWPQEATRSTLLIDAFGARQVDESHRARLRVEIGRLRAELSSVCGLIATPGGYALSPQEGCELVVLDPAQDGPHAGLLGVLSDGEAWSSAALALVLGRSQRSVQRALEALAGAGKVRSHGDGRSRRWIAPPIPGFPTGLLLMNSITPV